MAPASTVPLRRRGVTCYVLPPAGYFVYQNFPTWSCGQHNQPTAAPRVFLGKERRHCALAERLVYVINFVYSVIVIDVVLSKFTC